MKIGEMKIKRLVVLLMLFEMQDLPHCNPFNLYSFLQSNCTALFEHPWGLILLGAKCNHQACHSLVLPTLGTTQGADLIGSSGS